MNRRPFPRFLRRLFRVLLFVIALLAIGWAEENWRGARAWQDCRETLEAGDEILDPSKMPVVIMAPDDRNFMLSAAWGQPVFPPGATVPQFPSLQSPPSGDPDKWPLAAWAELEPVVRDLGNAARAPMRSELPSRIQSVDCNPAIRRFFDLMFYRSRAALRAKQPDAAADSIDMMFRLEECMERSRGLHARLSAVSLSGSLVFAFPPRAGWTVEQCRRFERWLRAIDCLAGGGAPLRFERAWILASFDSVSGGSPERTSPPAWWPRGWKDLARRAYSLEMQRRINHADSWPARTLEPFRPRDSSGEMPWVQCGLRLAAYEDWLPDCLEIQMHLCAARLALAVDHYRALYHAEPPSPDALRPLLGGSFPFNPVTSAPLTIDVSSDGKWSFRQFQKDDRFDIYPDDWDPLK